MIVWILLSSHKGKTVIKTLTTNLPLNHVNCMFLGAQEDWYCSLESDRIPYMLTQKRNNELLQMKSMWISGPAESKG